MAKFRLTATTTDAGRSGQTVGELVVEKASRDEALMEGVADLLRGSQFPPEIVDVYVQGMARATDAIERADVQDIILDKFHLQFWCKEAEEAAVSPPTVSPATQGVPVAFSQPVPQPSQTGGAPPSHLTPRQILRFELKRLTKEMSAVRTEKRKIDERYDDLKERRDECRQLLRTAVDVSKRGSRVKDQGQVQSLRRQHVERLAE